MLKGDNVQKGEKREAILQAALELIAEYGLQHTTMSLISKHSRASAGIIYHYFESKEDLLQSLYYRIKGDMSRAIAAADDTRQPLARRFQSLWLSIFRYCLAHPQEMAFLEQYECVPMVKRHDAQYHSEAKTLDDLIEHLSNQDMLSDLPLEVKTLYGLIKDLRTQDLVKNFPLEVIGEFTFGVALRLARQVNAGMVSLDEAALTDVAKACWDAIAR
ncbi:MAG: TetR/AcrR family transcriptional regulator [Chloroflexi bacterium]|nr:TetR/AcrR family transcriptional regulator [Chloroflexota bacterium]